MIENIVQLKQQQESRLLTPKCILSMSNQHVIKIYNKKMKDH